MERFYVLLCGDGKQQVISCELIVLDYKMQELGGSLIGDGDTREKAITNAAKGNSTVGGYDGYGTLPGPVHRMVG